MTESIRTVGDNVIIRRQEFKLQSEAGILLSSISVEKPRTGVVVAVGNGKVNARGIIKKLDVKPGDRVIFEDCFSNETIEVNNEKLLVMGEDNVLAVIVKTQEEYQ